MIVYEVNLTVDSSIYDEYIEWLRAHIDEILELEGFMSALILESRAATHHHRSLVVHYRIESEEALNAYFEGPARRIRTDGAERFGDQATASRRVLRVLE